MSLKLYQNLIYQVKEIVDVEIGVIDEAGVIIASSEETKVGTENPLIRNVIDSSEQVVSIGGMTFQKIVIKNRLEQITYIASENENRIKHLALFSINVNNLKMYYDEKFDKSNFIKNVITDNILPGDVQLRAKELHLVYNAYRVVFLIKADKKMDIHAHDILEGLFPNRIKDFVIILDDENMVLIKEIKSEDDQKEVDKTAKAIVDTLGTELMVKVYIGIGTIVDNIRDIGRSFKEAQMALLVGRIFENDKFIINYNKLGIGRLIYQIPTNLCELFLKEVIKEGALDMLDAETSLTIQKFFENNLNVSETSRQLYVHRNTLVYRLDKIQKMTGLDLRNFDDAIIFKVAILVKRYLDKGNKLL